MGSATVRGHSGRFVAAAAVMVAGLVDEAAAVTTLDVWQWLVAAGLAVAVGLLRLTSRFADAAPRTARTGRILARVAGTGAVLYLAVTVSFLGSPAVLGGENHRLVRQVAVPCLRCSCPKRLAGGNGLAQGYMAAAARSV